MANEDRYAVCCNMLRARSETSCGAKAYVSVIPGDAEGARVYVRSRGGRWIMIWERMKYLANFRTVTIPFGHPLYGGSGNRHGEKRNLLFDERKSAEAVAERGRKICCELAQPG